MKQTQNEWIKKQLLEKGSISRNEALTVYIARLASRIKDLEKLGFVVEAKQEKTAHGTDYRYFLKSSPYHKVERRVMLPDGEKLITSYER